MKIRKFTFHVKNTLSCTIINYFTVDDQFEISGWRNKNRLMMKYNECKKSLYCIWIKSHISVKKVMLTCLCQIYRRVYLCNVIYIIMSVYKTINDIEIKNNTTSEYW